MKNPLIVLLVIASIMIIANSFNSDKPSTSNKPKYLNAHVNFDGTTFHIYNKDSFDWTDTLLELNSDYKIKHKLIKSGQVYTVSPKEFAKGDGKRFNIYTHKLTDFFIYAKTPHGKLSYLGEY